MASNTINFTQGDTPLLNFPITVNSDVVDLTGYTAFFTLTSQTSPQSDATAEIEGTDALDSTAIAAFQLTETQTAPLQPNIIYNWDVKLKDPSGDYFATIVAGVATVKQSYTRRTS